MLATEYFGTNESTLRTIAERLSETTMQYYLLCRPQTGISNSHRDP